MTNQVFVSYSSRSTNDVRLLKSFLEHSGITSIWHDEDQLLAGVNLGEYIKKGVLESACCIFLLDEHSSNSKWCLVEVGAFWGANKPVIIYRPNASCEIPPAFAGIKVANSPDEIVRAVKAMPQQSAPALVVTKDFHVERLVGDIYEAIKEKVTSYVKETENPIPGKVNAQNKVEALIGTEAIVKAATVIIEACSNDDSIYATSQYSSHEPVSDDYVNAMAERLDMVTRLTIGGGGSDGGGGSSGELEARARLFPETLEDRLIKKRAKHPWPFEVLIVGNSMIIALRGTNQTYEAAIQVTDSEFVAKASKWFGEVVWTEADIDHQSEDTE